LFYALVALFIKRTNWLYVVIPALVGVYLLMPWSPTARFIGWPYLLEFLAGFLIARLPLRHGGLLVSSGALLLLVAPVGIHDPMRALYWGLPSGMIVYGALAIEERFKKGVFDGIVWLGDASYSIYLAHNLFFFSWVPALLAPFIMLAGSCLVFIAIESPLIRYGRSRISPNFAQKRNRMAACAPEAANSVVAERL
jgi:peptidoglycan/LPS O-acetylase OafA/YrhL